jgi:prolyl-tRNA synthetase
MRRSQSFIKTRKEVPADEEAKNAQLLIRAGFVHKQMAGVYAYLPLGLRVLENIKQVVRQEMDALKGEELIMTNLQRQELWQITDRWDDQKVDIWFKSELKNGTKVGLAWSHEEPITDMMRSYLSSYRDLPAYVYQFQTKLRNELRSKSGLMRGREFVMKDLYSYSRSEEEHQKFYDNTTKAYQKIFERLGLGNLTFLTYASGGDFTQFSHEFQTLSNAGEDTIYLDRDRKMAVNQEVYSPDILNQLGLEESKLEKVNAAEVGNIFNFGTSKSSQLGLYFTDESGKEKPVVLGSYGIGISRLMGVIAELFADDKGLNWPINIAPYKIYLASLGDNQIVNQTAGSLYKDLQAAGIDVIYDDRPDSSPGEKFADADLMGIPLRVVISDKSLAAGGLEAKPRNSEEIQILAKEDAVSVLADMLKS